MISSRLVTNALAFFLLLSASLSSAAPHRKTRGIQFLNPGLITLPTAKVGQPFTVSLTTYLTNPSATNLTWESSGLPAWLTMSKTGTLTGTPPAASIQAFKISVADSEVGDLDHPFQVIVVAPPIWTGALDLGTGTVGQPYTFNTSPFVTNPAGTGTIAFSANGLPAWVSINPATGVLSGTPGPADFGPFSGTIIATVAGQGSTPTTGTGTIKVAPPFWTANPITLPDGNDASPYSQNITSYTVNPELTPLTFSKVAGPAWFSVSAAGILNGAPAKTDVGAVSVTAQFSTVIGGVTYTAQTVFKFNIVHIKRPPAWTQNPVTLPPATVGQAFAFNLNTVASDPEAGTIAFTAAGLPPWLTLNGATGVLTGTPGPSTGGPFAGITFTATASGGSANAAGNGTVEIVAPFWKANPITLVDATDAAAYLQNVSAYAVNPEATPMVFSKVAGPAWVSVSATGVLSGSPATADVGPVTVTVQFSTTILGQTYTPSTVFQFNVVHIKRPPVWSQNPVVLPSATVGQPFTFNLNTVVTDPEGGTLAFTVTGLPTWLALNGTTGVLSGTPGPSAGGPYGGITFTATASGGSANAAGSGTVVIVPPFWTANPITLPDASDAAAYSQAVSQYAINPQGTVMSFSKVAGPAWASVSGAGVISGSPGIADDGPVNVTAKFSTVILGKTYTAQTVFQFNVVHVKRPPVWSQNPVVLPPATVAHAFTYNLNLVVTDPEGGAIAFSASGLPSWLVLNPTTGVLTGTPGLSNAGAFTGITFTATASGGSANAAGRGTVIILYPTWDGPVLNLGTATVGQAFTFALAPHVTVPAGAGNVTFSAVGLPGWQTLNPATGVLSGTPGPGDIMSYTVPDITATLDGQGSASVSATGKVVPVAPFWTGNPITLPEGTDAAPYSQGISQYAVNPQNTPMTFAKVSGPAWVAVSATGVMSGAPAKTDVGDVAVTAKFTTTIAGTVYTAATIFQFKITHVKRPPAWTQNPVVLPPATVGQAYSYSIRPLVTDPEGGTITITATGLPAWLVLNSAGLLTGTPALADAGPFSGITFTATAIGGSANAAGQGSVGIIAPKWKGNPLALPKAIVGTLYTQDVVPFVINPNAVAVTYTKTAGATWVAVSPTGSLSGTPGTADVGTASVSVQLSATVAGVPYTDSTTFTFTVGTPLLPPVWTFDEINLGTEYVGQAFTFNLNTVVQDPQGGALTFSATGLPAWLALNANGILTGTPAASHVGSYTGIVFTATGAGGNASANGFGVVVNPAFKPRWIANPIILPNATPGLTYSQALAPFVMNPSNLAITYTMASAMPPPWISVSSAGGTLFGTPAIIDAGPVEISITLTAVADGKTVTDTTVFRFTVTSPGKPPVWLQDPIAMTAVVAKPFSNSLVPFAKDPANLALTFSKVSGNAWLAVAANGALSGTPGTSDVGTDTFTVKVCNTVPLCVTATLNITVTNTPPVITDTTQVDSGTGEAFTENLWVVGSYRQSECFRQKVGKAIHAYYEELAKAQIHHSGVMISAYAKGKADPIEGAEGTLFTWKGANPITDFQKRLSDSFVAGLFVYQNNSPVWSMGKFYKKLPSLPIYQASYFQKSVPTEVMVVSEHDDSYQHFQKGTEMDGWNVSQWTEWYQALHKPTNKPFTISAIASHCGEKEADEAVGDSRRDATAANGTYGQLVENTHGNFYNENVSEIQLEAMLRDYAAKVSFRARVSSNHFIPLSKTPSDVGAMKVMLAGKLLFGNTGAGSDMWAYRASVNSVELFWDRIGLQDIKPGDKVTVTYPTASRRLAKD